MNSMSCKKFDWYEKFALYSGVISYVYNLVEIFLEVGVLQADRWATWVIFGLKNYLWGKNIALKSKYEYPS